MPLEKIADYDYESVTYTHTPTDCISSEHNPPMYMVMSPGVYEYTCPACGEKRQFTVHPTFY